MNYASKKATIAEILSLLEPANTHQGPSTPEQHAEALRLDPSQLDPNEVIAWLDGLLADTDGEATVQVSRAQLILFAALAQKAAHHDTVLDAIERVLDEIGKALTGSEAPEIRPGDLPEVVGQVVAAFAALVSK
ncbi:hypothetical protein ACFWVM_29255 [Nocardia fluminea]|uniref:hypothetical protein n=1 Tax=Nocardia fluminea TaxID=134984 RepID=UPI00364BEDB7